MKSRIAAFFLFVAAAAYLGAEQTQQPTKSKPLSLSGLTDGLAGALASRPATLVRIGSKEISLEGFFAEDLAAAFKCDAAANAYLDRAAGEASYEALADAIRYELEESLGPYAIVEASAIGDGSLMRFGIALSLSKDVELPVSLGSADGKLATSFTLPCRAELEFEAELFVDSGLVNEGKAPRGQVIGIKDFSVSLKSRTEGPDASEEAEGAEPRDSAPALEALAEVPLAIGKKKYLLEATEFSLDAWTGYRLNRPSGDGPDTAKYRRPEGEAGEYGDSEPERLLSYEDFSEGDYAWEPGEYVALDLWFKETGERPKSERGREAFGLSYSYRDLSGAPASESLVFYDGVESRELEGPATRASKKGKK